MVTRRKKKKIPVYDFRSFRSTIEQPFRFEWTKGHNMTLNMPQRTFGYLRKVSFQISLRSLRRLIWNDTFRFMYFMYFYCLEEIYFSTKSNVVVKCRLGDCAGWSVTALCTNIPSRVLQPISDMSSQKEVKCISLIIKQSVYTYGSVTKSLGWLFREHTEKWLITKSSGQISLRGLREHPFHHSWLI